MNCKKCNRSLVGHITHKGLCYQCFIKLGDEK
jgi:hypothetical protein